jgi:hypothetical protein
MSCNSSSTVKKKQGAQWVWGKVEQESCGLSQPRARDRFCVAVETQIMGEALLQESTV